MKRVYRGNTDLIKAAALDLAAEIGLPLARIVIDVSTLRNDAMVSIVEHNEIRIDKLLEHVKK